MRVRKVPLLFMGTFLLICGMTKLMLKRTHVPHSPTDLNFNAISKLPYIHKPSEWTSSIPDTYWSQDWINQKLDDMLKQTQVLHIPANLNCGAISKLPYIHKPSNWTSSIPDAYWSQDWVNRKLDDIKFVTTHQRNICTGDEFILITVLSAVGDFNSRKAVRKTWGRIQMYLSHKIASVFFIGTSRDKNISQSITLEMERYRDVVLLDYTDSYEFLTMKTVLAMKWTLMYCPKVKYVLRTTDDVLFSYRKLFAHLETFSLDAISGLYFGCGVHGYKDRSILTKGRSAIVSEVNWTNLIWPPYVSGSFVILGMDTIVNMYTLSCHTPLTFPDDTYLGVLAEMLGYTVRGNYKTLCINPPTPEYGSFRMKEHDVLRLVRWRSPALLLHFGGSKNATARLEIVWKLFKTDLV